MHVFVLDHGTHTYQCSPLSTPIQGSAKLEKAEILQMTVDHLRHLHQSRDARGTLLTPKIHVSLLVLFMPRDLYTASAIRNVFPSCFLLGTVYCPFRGLESWPMSVYVSKELSRRQETKCDCSKA